MVVQDPLIDWISDTLSKGYTDLQSLVKCLDRMQSSKVVLGCATVQDREAQYAKHGC